MADRYFVQDPIPFGGTTERKLFLAGQEAHHLIHVMRVRPGVDVTLFDGSGAEFSARVERVDRREVELVVLSRQQIDRELPLEVTLAVALPKGDRQRWLIEKATELGITRVVPIKTDRSVAQPVPRVLARLRRTVIEASKQSGRNRLMDITPSQDWADFVNENTDVPCRLLAHQGDESRDFDPSMVGDASRAILAVGPEGGFTDEEVSTATAAGWQPIDLGPRILRIETAAVLLTAMVAI